MPMHLHCNGQSFTLFINVVLRQIYSEVKELEGDVTELVSGKEEGVPAILSTAKKLGGTPMERSFVIRSLPQAFEAIKGMDLTPGWESDYRQSA